MFKTLNFIVFFLFFSVLSHAQTSVPDIKLNDINGKSLSIKEYSKDKLIVFSFWATWCVPCINELDAISEDYDTKKSELKFELIAVSIDDEKTKSRVKPLVSGKGWDYKILMDTNQAFKRAMNISSVPFVVVVKNGKVVYTHSGYTPGAEKELYKKLKTF